MIKIIDIRMIGCLLLSMLYSLYSCGGIKFYGVNSINEMKYFFENAGVMYSTDNDSMKDDSYGIGMTMHILPR
ncbi:hypothetical protein [Hafnia paralvei]|uniref:hypothetical protein n=1 Tax=Hafnia paralvei TaxID=546367 RepID=UPI003C2E0C48